ncbi:hypothetical protein GE21DRAFT_9671 [Neurospora crassa]|uniref:Uncharacterized protein n=1 Tax=Neurospora crassa (strain ATCC 24698 / 74-OR23-1A / CBS 708.71 / DSM 1257 / FGSC 987) TaxID=367110 RepID=Q7S010_NEUCR|nr:hypothetical protein NCU09431 [Neurospora crassa OR74A]EAA28623.1 hypothetical protein NCU09431 [Neurospora crassa OR74A]KHE87241.1 hypothetical protein GE21DRAFT_9671 [Neurospora crassa]|eukprot:XP_957859.1 hypothetical protein NCU09431 [Neurospora crassa OR74A]
MAPFTMSRILCGLLLFFLGTFALLADTTKTGSGQLSKAETRRLAASATATVPVATPAPLVVIGTRTTTVSTIAITTTTALARAEPTPSNVVIVAPAPTTVTAKPEPAAPSLLHAAPLPDDPFRLFHNDDNSLLSCYSSGRQGERWKFIESIDNFCHALDRESLSRRIPLTGFRQHSYNWEELWVRRYTHYDISLDVKPGCEWEFDSYECGQYLRIPVDMCDMEMENDKKGGEVQARTGYGDRDVQNHVWKGDEVLKQYGEARLGDLEKKGMSRTCLVWRIDLVLGHIDGADNVEGFPDGVGIDLGPDHDHDDGKVNHGG